MQCKDVVRRLTRQSRWHKNLDLAKYVCYRWAESVLDCRGSEASNIRSRKSKLLWGRQRNKRDRKTLESAGCRMKCWCSFVVEGRNVKEQQALEPLASCHPFLWLGRGWSRRSKVLCAEVRFQKHAEFVRHPLPQRGILRIQKQFWIRKRPLSIRSEVSCCYEGVHIYFWRAGHCERALFSDFFIPEVEAFIPLSVSSTEVNIVTN